jgi:hypothetical protein
MGAIQKEQLPEKFMGYSVPGLRLWKESPMPPKVAALLSLIAPW